MIQLEILVNKTGNRTNKASSNAEEVSPVIEDILKRTDGNFMSLLNQLAQNFLPVKLPEEVFLPTKTIETPIKFEMNPVTNGYSLLHTEIMPIVPGENAHKLDSQPESFVRGVLQQEGQKIDIPMLGTVQPQPKIKEIDNTTPKLDNSALQLNENEDRNTIIFPKTGQTTDQLKVSIETGGQTDFSQKVDKTGESTSSMIDGTEYDASSNIQPLVKNNLFHPVMKPNQLIVTPIHSKSFEDVSMDDEADSVIPDHLVGTENFSIPGLMPTDKNNRIHHVQETMIPNGKLGNEGVVRAAHFDKDVSLILQNAIHINDVKDGIEAAFSLKPHDLGNVEVKVVIKDGIVTAEFLAATPYGKDLLETNITALRTSLELAGLQVDKIDITQQSSNLSSSFSHKGDSQARQGYQDSKKRNGHAAYIIEEEYHENTVDHSRVSQINTTA